MPAEPPPPLGRAVGPAALAGATLLLFLVWSNTFLAFEVLLAPKRGAAPMRWTDLMVARFVPVTLVCAAWCFTGARRAPALAVLRRAPLRLAVCGLLVGVGYGGFMYYGIERRVSGPVASLMTTLSPLYMLILGAVVFRERIGPRQLGGLVLGMTGVALVATARTGEVAPWDVFVLGLAQVCWSVYSILTKPMMRTVPTLLWTYLVLVVGGVPLLLAAPFVGGPAMAALDVRGWALLLYLSLFATVLGNALWSWLLRHLPASTTGLTVFLNPPLTTVSKWLWAAAFPLAFTFSIKPQEWVGGAVALAGVALAILGRRPAATPAPAPPPAEAAAATSPVAARAPAPR